MLFDEEVSVISNSNVGTNLYILKLAAPRTANAIQPGQFVHINLGQAKDHVLRRPFSIYAADPAEGTVDILYQVVGKGTDKISDWEPGSKANMIAPIGQGWRIPDGTKHALLVGGGVGAAPLFMLAEELLRREVAVDVVLGASTADALVCRDRYAGLSCSKLACSTDDGTYGHSGFCTSLVEQAIADSKDASYDYLAVCGPEPLMRIVSSMAEEANIRCEVSMERRMACGIGACLSCVVDTIHGKKRACVDGPIFEAGEIVW